ncbi:MAG: hypothetical protein ABI934_12120 [Actinomycetota bacterium]
MTATLVALMGVLMVPTAPVASAVVGGSCSIVVSPTVAVDRPYKLISATLGSDCAASGASFDSWDVRHSYYGPSGSFIFDNTGSDTEAFYDWEHYGTYYVEPSLAFDSDYNDLTQNTVSYVVKSASRVGVSATRLGSYVTVSAWATYYSPAADGFRPWVRARAALQYRACNTCAWTSLRAIYTGSTGKAAYRAYAPKARYYRAISTGTTMVWGKTSAVIVR